jgi:hypothetical protein
MEIAVAARSRLAGLAVLSLFWLAGLSGGHNLEGVVILEVLTAIPVAVLLITLRGLAQRRRQIAEEFAGSASPSGLAHGSSWQPTFPATLAAPMNPTDPASWLNVFLCNGEDAHQLTVPIQGTAATGLMGAALLAFAMLFNVGLRGIEVGAGLLLVPRLMAMFSSRVDGRYDLKLWIAHPFGDATYLPR